MISENERDILPTIGDIIGLAEDTAEAEVFSQLRKDKEDNKVYGYSVLIKKIDGVWKLMAKQKGGLRVILSKPPRHAIKQIRITYYCNSKTCCFGEVIEQENTQQGSADKTTNQEQKNEI